MVPVGWGGIGGVAEGSWRGRGGVVEEISSGSLAAEGWLVRVRVRGAARVLLRLSGALEVPCCAHGVCQPCARCSGAARHSESDRCVLGACWRGAGLRSRHML